MKRKLAVVLALCVLTMAIPAGVVSAQSGPDTDELPDGPTGPSLPEQVSDKAVAVLETIFSAPADLTDRAASESVKSLGEALSGLIDP